MTLTSECSIVQCFAVLQQQEAGRGLGTKL